MADDNANKLMAKLKMHTPEGAIKLDNLLARVRRIGPKQRAYDVLNEEMTKISVYHPEVYDQDVKDAITRALGSSFNIKWDTEDLDGPGDYGFGGNWWNK